jgi:hypothetical protein
MNYTVYKITNTINGNIYIGAHQTENLNDAYFGSGKLLKRALNKYGADNFTKEYLNVFDNEDEMYAYEAELVTSEFIQESTNYNICPGGHGGWTYVNSVYQKDQRRLKSNGKPGGDALANRLKTDANFQNIHRNRFIETMKGVDYSKENNGFFGKTHSIDSRLKISIKLKGKPSGMRWITNGTTAKQFSVKEPIPDGWRAGRK